MLVDWPNVYVCLHVAGRAVRPADPRMSTWDPVSTCQGLALCHCGQATVRTRQGPVEVRPGTCLWIKPGWSYDTTYPSSNPLGNYFITFDLLNRQRRPLAPQVPLPPDVMAVERPAFVQATMHRIVELVLHALWQRGMAPAVTGDPEHAIAEALLRGLLMELDHATAAHAAGGVGSEQRQRLTALATRVLTAPEQYTSVRQMADECHYCADHFARLFAQLTGQPAKAFLVAARVRRAQELLRTTTLSVKQLADLLQYRSVQHFTLQFRQHTGQPPAAYRRGY